MADAPPSPTLYEVPYTRLFPWLRLFRCPGSAIDPKRLMLAALGLLLMNAGWNGLERVFSGSGVHTSDQEWATADPWFQAREGNWSSLVEQVGEPLIRFSAPFASIFDPSTRGRGALAHAGLAGLWALVVWGLIGGAIARIAVVALTRGERVGIVEAVRFAARKAGPLILSPLVPLLGIIVVAALIAPFGLLYRIPGTAGALTAGIVAFLPLIGGLILAMIVVGLAAGWPLMNASVAAESEDGFDAMSRSYAYVHQRPWHYAGYVVLAVGLGIAGLLFVHFFAALVVQITAWALQLLGPPARVAPYFALGVPESGTSLAALRVHQWWLMGVGLLARGWVYAYFWTAATAIYLLLRRDVDGTPWNAIAYQGRPGALADAVAGPTVVPAAHAPDPRS